MKINPYIINKVTYKHANFYVEILCIVDYIKIIKSDKIWRFETIDTQVHTFVIFV
jgi:hypothetical protein